MEHRALTPLPYWKIPGANDLIPRLQDFNRDMDLLNSKLYELIDGCLEERDPQVGRWAEGWTEGWGEGWGEGRGRI